MGLELVEIILEVEESFGIKIEDDDLVDPATKERPAPIYHTRVGDLYRLILNKRHALGLDKPDIPLEIAALSKIQAALGEVLGVAREAIRPADNLADLFPRETRRRQWRQLRRQLRGVGPLVADRRWYRVVQWTMCFAASSGWVAFLLRALFATAERSGRRWLGVIVPVGITIAIAIALGVVTTAIIMALPVWPHKGISPDSRTVQDLARTHLARNRTQYVAWCGGDSDDDVWRTLQTIIADTLGIEIAEVTKEADLIKDLGAG